MAADRSSPEGARLEARRDGHDEPQALLHRLNNQLGVILAHAELLEAKAADPAQRGRASQVVSAAVKAIAVSRELNETLSA